eukprot:tig00000405_g461.t1
MKGRPSNADAQPDELPARKDPTQIKNKMKRQEMYEKLKRDKKHEKSKERKKRKREAEALGEAAPPKQKPRTLDNTREAEETVVTAEDEEVLEDEKTDEYADYFAGKVPKTLITSSKKPSARMYTLIAELLKIFPNSFFYNRKDYEVKEIVKYATNKEFTDLVIINEDRKNFNGLWLIHLPGGPTAHFKLSNVRLPEEIKGHGRTTSHRPELILNNFTTRLGRRVGRMFAALFPHDPNFRGRRVVTYHNQRDFIFFRHHRYIFDSEKKARLQELGPRFTLKLRSLQAGTFDTKYGEYEWVHKTEMDTSRRRFFL